MNFEDFDEWLDEPPAMEFKPLAVSSSQFRELSDDAQRVLYTIMSGAHEALRIAPARENGAERDLRQEVAGWLGYVLCTEFPVPRDEVLAARAAQTDMDPRDAQ